MSGRARLILTAVMVLLLCALLYLFGIRPQREELAQIRTDIEAAESITIQLTAELQRLQELQANQAELEAELARFRQFVPLRPELANFIFQVQAAADAAGLDFVDITPELPVPPPEGAALAQVRSQIGAVGGYFALQDFVRRVYGMDRAMRVDNFGLTVQSLEPFGTRLRMDMAVRMFYELPEPTAAATTTTPGATPTPTATP